MEPYVRVNVRPEICDPFQVVPGKRPATKLEYKSLNKTTRFFKSLKSKGLKFVPLNLEKTILVLTARTSLSNADQMKSQLGYVILMVEDDSICYIIHYGSNRCKRVAVP